MPRISGLRTRSDTNRGVQLQNLERGLGISDLGSRWIAGLRLRFAYIKCSFSHGSARINDEFLFTILAFVNTSSCKSASLAK